MASTRAIESKSLPSSYFKGVRWGGGTGGTRKFPLRKTVSTHNFLELQHYCSQESWSQFAKTNLRPSNKSTVKRVCAVSCICFAQKFN